MCNWHQLKVNLGLWTFVVLRGSHGSNLLISTRGGLEFPFRVCYGRGWYMFHFWYDIWCGEVALKNLFPDLFFLTKDKVGRWDLTLESQVCPSNPRLGISVSQLLIFFML
jgi:hypothetical protein